MTADLKRSLLACVFEEYDEIAGEFPAACVRGCSACCTTRVMATSAEADFVLVSLEESGKRGMITEVANQWSPTINESVLSVNALAEYCIRKEDPPDTYEEPENAPCPLREHDGYPIYEVRPFACRTMWSRVVCRKGGEAIMDALQVTLAGVFQQILEDIDHGGLYGNFLDVLSNLLAPKNARAYRSGRPLSPVPVLTTTRPNPGFIVPPEHRKQVGSYLARLWQREVAGIPFRAAVDLVKKQD